MLRGPRKVHSLQRIFNTLADDTTFYLAYGRQRRTRFLTNRAGETFMLNWITGDDEVAASCDALSAYMTHSVPLLGDLPLSSLLRIRRQDRESFGRYRAAIERMLAEVQGRKKRVTKREIQELFRDQIDPELTKMKAELSQERRRQRNRFLAGIGTLAASVGLGAFGAIVPALATAATVGAAAAAGIGGTRLLGRVAESACEHGASLQEKNDFYFLLRLTQEAER